MASWDYLILLTYIMIYDYHWLSIYWIIMVNIGLLDYINIVSNG